MRNIYFLFVVTSVFFSRVGAADEGTAPAAPALSTPSPEQNVDDLSLEKLLDIPVKDLIGMVVTASRQEQRLDEAPAIITVISAERIADRGYLTVAEAVSDVAGIYVIDDQYMPSIGVRGVNAGLRSWSRIVKILIDGQPVPFRVDGTNWSGLELIPLSAVQQIEVLRGPASALFGADAYLGVINIITRGGTEVFQGMATIAGHLVNGNPGVSGEAETSGESGALKWMLTAGMARIDRSGLTVPATYPNFKPEPFANADGTPRTTKGDIRVPISAYGRVEYQTRAGLFGLNAHFQKLTTSANFQDWAPLPTETTTEDQHNLFVRGRWQAPLGERHAFQASIAYSQGAFDPKDHLELNDPGKFFVRHAGYRATDLNLEYSFTPSVTWATKVGLNASHEWHDLLQYSVTLKEDAGVNKKGDVIDLQPRRSLNLPSAGLYVQGSWTPIKPLLFTVGARVDTYKGATNMRFVPSARAGVVYRFAKASSLKLLYGRSFKSPSPMFRYAPGGLGGSDILGNADLLHETADTFELGGLWLPLDGKLRLEGTVFRTTIDDFTEFVANGKNYTARNRKTATSIGFELDASYRLWFGELFAQYSFASANRPYDSTSFASRDDQLTNQVRLAAYPTHQLRVGAKVPIEPAHLQLYVSVGYIGDRRGTESTILENDRRVYVIPGYVPVDVVVSSRGLKPFGDHETRVLLKVRDLLNQRSPEPGFNGADIPSVGRQFMLSLAQTW